MITMDDYRKADGNVDWPAYQKAQVAAGELCYRCRAYIPQGLLGRNGPAQCVDCKLLDQKHDVTHEVFIRCPKCGETESVHESGRHGLLCDGDHKVVCGTCNHTYTIETTVTFTFRSPERCVEPDPSECLRNELYEDNK